MKFIKAMATCLLMMIVFMCGSVAVSAGERTTMGRIDSSNFLFIKKDGTVWKSDTNNKNTRDTLIQVQGVYGVKYLTDVRYNNAYAIGEDGTVWSWNGETLAVDEDLRGAVYVVCGEIPTGDFQFKIMEDGSLWGKGTNSWGNLTTIYGDKSEPTDAKGTPISRYDDWIKIAVDDVKSIFIEGKNVTALKNDGTVWFWGVVGPTGPAARGVNTLSPYGVAESKEAIADFSQLTLSRSVNKNLGSSVYGLRENGSIGLIAYHNGWGGLVYKGHEISLPTKITRIARAVDRPSTPIDDIIALNEKGELY